MICSFDNNNDKRKMLEEEFVDDVTVVALGL
jgi:hypothetical protein